MKKCGRFDEFFAKKFQFENICGKNSAVVCCWCCGKNVLSAFLNVKEFEIEIVLPFEVPTQSPRHRVIASQLADKFTGAKLT